jgi:hypothetical protein
VMAEALMGAGAGVTTLCVVLIPSVNP